MVGITGVAELAAETTELAVEHGAEPVMMADDVTGVGEAEPELGVATGNAGEAAAVADISIWLLNV